MHASTSKKENVYRSGGAANVTQIDLGVISEDVAVCKGSRAGHCSDST